MKKILTAVLVAVLSLAGLAACTTEADTVSNNLSKQAEQFEVTRRIVFINGITDKYLLTIEGRCSIETTAAKVAGSAEVTCKIGDDTYIKDGMVLSDNVTVVWEQIAPNKVDPYHYEIVFRPETIAPYIDLKTSITSGNG